MQKYTGYSVNHVTTIKEKFIKNIKNVYFLFFFHIKLLYHDLLNIPICKNLYLYCVICLSNFSIVVSLRWSHRS